MSEAGKEKDTQDQIIFIKHTFHCDSGVCDIVFESLRMLYDYWTNSSVPGGSSSNAETKQTPRPVTAACACWDTRGIRMELMCCLYFRLSPMFQDINPPPPHRRNEKFKRIKHAHFACWRVLLAPQLYTLSPAPAAEYATNSTGGLKLSCAKKKEEKTVFCLVFDLFLQSSAKPKTHYVGF